MGSNDDILSINRRITQHPECKLYQIHNLLEDSYATQLGAEVRNIKLNHYVTDLFSASQCLRPFNRHLPTDHAILYSFKKLIENYLRKFVEELFGIETFPDVTISVSRYDKGDYLLCHDDLRTDRKIAFVYYLTEDWTAEDGGALRFFNHEGEPKEPLNEHYKATFVPCFNSIIMFEVNQMSHHEVQEIFTDKPRLSINGWFHSVDHATESNHDWFKEPLYNFSFVTSQNIGESQMMKHKFLHKRTVEQMSRLYIQQPVVSLQDVLNDTLYNKIVSELENPQLNWQTVQPANHRKYDCLELKQENKDSCITTADNLHSVDKLLAFLTTPAWLSYLQKMTRAKYLCMDGPAFHCFVEVQRWKEGSYYIQSDNDVSSRTGTIDVMILFKVDLTTSFKEGIMSGMICVQTNREDVLPPVNMKVPFWNMLHKAKNRKIEAFYYYLMKTERAKQKSTKQLTKQAKRKIGGCMKRFKRRVEHKLRMIRSYRASLVTQEFHIAPVNNTMLVYLNTGNSRKFNMYIQKGSTINTSTAYYCINVSYLVMPDYKMEDHYKSSK